MDISLAISSLAVYILHTNLAGWCATLLHSRLEWEKEQEIKRCFNL